MPARPLFASWFPVVVWGGVIWLAGTFQTGIGGALPGGDKFAHILTYGILGIAIARAMESDSSLPRRFTFLARSSIVTAAFLAACYGAVDEWHQSLIPGRYASGWDVLADALGGMLGAWLFVVAGLEDARGDTREEGGPGVPLAEGPGTA